MAENWPTEAAATAAVEAAAKKVYEDGRLASERTHGPGLIRPWDELPAIGKQQIKQQVLPIVWAALQSLPDPRYYAWQEGYSKGASAVHNDETENPYPASF